MKSATAKFRLFQAVASFVEEKRFLLSIALMLVCTCAVYFPVFHAGYIWDDEVMLTENPYVKSPDGLLGIWSGKTVDYLPVTFSMFWLEWRLFGENPSGYHVVNVLQHALGAVLLWRVLKRLKILGAFVGALIFAIHPVCVGSVAWISERKNTVSLVFYLLSILFYLRSGNTLGNAANDSAPGSKRNYLFSLGFFLLALLSKTSTVILPLVLLLCDDWRGRFSGQSALRNFSFWRKEFLRTIPFLALSLVFGLVTIWFQQHHAIPESGGAGDSLLTRLLGGSWALWFYLAKAIIPLNLSMVYPRWTIDALAPISYLPAVVWLVVLFSLWKLRGRIGRGWFFAMSYFSIALGPVLGVFDMYFLVYAQAADHWQYLALIAICAAIGAGLAWSARAIRRDASSVPGFLVFAPTACVLLTTSSLGWNRAKVFQNAETLWRDALKQNPGSWVAHNNLGNALEALGNSEEAFAEHAAALKLGPKSPDTHYNMAKHLARLGKTGEAIAEYGTALEIAPNYVKAHNNLGILLEARGATGEALKHYTAAVDLLPTYAIAHNNLAQLLLKEGKTAEALAHGLTALRLKPDFAQAHYNVANAYSLQHATDKAAQHFREALQQRHSYPDAHYNFGNLLAAQGKIVEARTHFQEAIRLRPEFADALNNLGNTFASEGNWTAALQPYFAALKANPEHLQALNSAGFSLLNLNQPFEAERLLRRAAALDSRAAETRLHLGLALLRQRKNAEAAAEFRAAAELRAGWAEPHFYLGMIALGDGNEAQAAEQFRLATKLHPAWREPANNLAWILATSRDGKIRSGSEALDLARRLQPNHDAASLDTLAAAFAESQNFPAAIQTAEQSLKLVRETGDEHLASEIARRLELYRQGKPFRETHAKSN